MNIGDPELRLVRKLGEGAFGQVFLCNSYHRNEYDKVVVKRINVDKSDSLMSNIEEEIYIFSQLRHPRVVEYLRSYIYANTINIVMEYMPNGTLRGAIEKMRKGYSVCNISQDKLLQYFCDILMGLEYLHIRHVIHRDLKPDNILLDAQGRAKISDFGISSIHVSLEVNSGMAGTGYYMAPETFLCHKFDFKSDIWSLGCIVHELCMGYSPYQRFKTADQIMCAMHTGVSFREVGRYFGSLWEQVCECMLKYKMQERYSLEEVVCLDSKITIRYYYQYFNYYY